jgi:GNAT superfamily N-acetyltransferase
MSMPVVFRVASSADVPLIEACRLPDPDAAPADHRMAAYFDGHHHPQQALAPRIGYLALVDGSVVGYIAAHLSTRHSCQGEVQYLYVAPPYRRQGVATGLMRKVAEWFREQHAAKVCVCVDADSPAAEPFYASLGATHIRKFWMIWNDITAQGSGS